MQSKESDRRAGRGSAAIVIGLTLAAFAVLALAAPLAHERGAPMGPMMGQGMGGGMGPGMMGPMMGRGMMMGPMMGQMGQGMGGGMGPGMMGRGMGPGTMMGPMMGRGMMMGPMMGQMGQGMGGPMGGGMMMGPMGRGMMTGPGMGAGMMTGPGIGPAWIYGAPGPVGRRLSVEDVRTDLDRRLAWHGNKRLKLGTVAEKDDTTVTAEIVTVDGSLVQRLEIDRRTGQMWQTD